MVLLLDKRQIETFPLSTHKLVRSFPVYRNTAKTFLSIEEKEIGPKGLLYVAQREFAVLLPNDRNVSIIGSDDATTYIIVILRHSKSGATALAHFDSIDLDDVIPTMVQQIQDLSSNQLDGRIALYFIGGHCDRKNVSEEIFLNALDIFQSLPNEIDLRLACVGHLNTVVRNGLPRPNTYGAGVDLKTGEIFPAKFTVKGPREELRRARLYTSRNFVKIYDVQTGLLTITPFSYVYRIHVDFLLSQNDTSLLKYSSLSPFAEPPDFLLQTKRALRFIKDNPDLSSTVFKGNQPHYFKRNEDCSSWIYLN